MSSVKIDPKTLRYAAWVIMRLAQEPRASAEIFAEAPGNEITRHLHLVNLHEWVAFETAFTKLIDEADHIEKHVTVFKNNK